MNFNPTVIRIKKVGLKTAMVITNGMTGPVYFQVYDQRAKVGTFLHSSRSWNDEKGAINDFDFWATNNV